MEKWLILLMLFLHALPPQQKNLYEELNKILAGPNTSNLTVILVNLMQI